MSRKENFQLRYVLPTGQSLLTTRLMECISDHKRGKTHIYDHFPSYDVAMAIADQNTVLIVQVSESGPIGVS